MLFGEYISKQPTIFQMFVATQCNILNKPSGQFPAMLMSTKPDISDMTQQFPAVFVETTRRFLKRRLAIFKPCLWEQNINIYKDISDESSGQFPDVFVATRPDVFDELGHSAAFFVATKHGKFDKTSGW